MMQGASRNILLPAFIGSGVLVIAFTLLAIVARSPYTHSNLDSGFDLRYTRTEQIVVGAPIPFGGGVLAVPTTSDPVQLGRRLFVADSCATCHGLDGRGGIVGPSVVGTKVDKLRSVTQVGPKGMPAYAAGGLSDADLEAIAAYLDAMGK